MSRQYIDLDRDFFPLDRRTVIQSDFDELYADRYAKSVKWPELLGEWRVIILAEPGAGKTREIIQATLRQRAEGKPAFFLRLEDLPRGVPTSFYGPDTGTYKEFSAWRDGENESWLFLDSVDEARLQDPTDFERAIRALANELGDAAQRAHVFITSRILEWQPATDLDFVDQQLRLQSASKKAQTPSTFAPSSTPSQGSAASERPSDDHRETRVFGLGRLNEKQIRDFAHASKVERVDAFLQDIRRADAMSFATRPGDLDDIILVWNEEKQIGSLSKLISTSVDIKLKERDRKRARRQTLTPEQAKQGAMTLAAAAAVMKLQRFSVPDEVSGPAAIEASEILSDWSQLDCVTLLNRPIFDQAIYGAVRFHHRPVREFLAACWFDQLLRQGRPRAQLEQLLFTEQYGWDVAVPAMQPILPWLSIFDDKIRERTFKVAPGLLIEGGDPSQLPVAFRAKILASVCARATAENAYPSFDNTAIIRFAEPEIGPFVKALFHQYGSEEGPRTLLLRLVRQGQLRECMDEILAIALDRAFSVYTRALALRAAREIASLERRQEIAAVVVGKLTPLDDEIAAALIAEYAPEAVEVGEVIAILGKVGKNRLSTSASLESALDRYIVQLKLPDLQRFIEGVFGLLKTPPYEADRPTKISETHRWLAAYGAKACLSPVQAKALWLLGDQAIGLLSLVAVEKHWSENARRKDEPLRQAVYHWNDLNDALFWHDVTEVREREAQKGSQLTEYWLAGIMRGLWSFEPADFNRVASWIKSRELFDDRLVALSLAFELWMRGEKQPDELELLFNLSANDPRLSARLASNLDPVPTPAQLEMKQELERMDLQRAEHLRKHQESEQQWRLWLQDHLDNIADVTLAPAGKIWTSQHYLYDKIQSNDEDRGHWGKGNWRSLETEFGAGVADAFRTGATRYWRAYKPLLRSQGIENPNSVPFAVVFGLTGLKIEAAGGPAWTQELGADDATTAMHYALREMNGFPPWLTKLFEARPETVSAVISSEVRWEMVQPRSTVAMHYILYDLAWNGAWLDEVAGPITLQAMDDCVPADPQTLRSSLRILMRCKAIADEPIARAATAALAKDLDLELEAIWFAALVSTDPKAGMAKLRTALLALRARAEAQSLIAHFAVTLLGARHEAIDARVGFRTAPTLKELYLLFQEYYPSAEDVTLPDGKFHPVELLRQAQRLRDQLLDLIVQIEGKDSFVALEEIRNHHPEEHMKKALLGYLRRRAEADADFQAWTAADFRAFAATTEHDPRTNRELHDLAMFRLEEYRQDLEEGDDSTAETLRLQSEETKLRVVFANHLRQVSRNRYEVLQEEELPDRKRTDIRLRSPLIHGALPIELKIADKWKGPVLFERLENQLCNDYMRAEASRCGIFLLAHRGLSNVDWEHPETGERLSFRQLLAALRKQVALILAARPEFDQVSVVGIDFTKRTTPIRTVEVAHRVKARSRKSKAQLSSRG